jgi:perosamine synthetase
MSNLNIPLFKVNIPHQVSEVIEPVLYSGYLADGLQVKQFEQILGDYIGNSQVTALSDISGAITLALFMAGVRPGDRVITSPLACTATTMPIANLFADPIWCDVNPYTGMMEANQIAALITPKTKAILLLHWSGDVAEIEEIINIAHTNGIKVIEDASEAFGAECKGKRLGNHGADFTAYSFQAIRHITTIEGAALFCANAEDAEQAKWLKRYGINRSSFRLPNGDFNQDSDIPIAGYNFYLNNVNAAIGIEQFQNIDAVVNRYRENGDYYSQALKKIDGVELLHRRSDSISAYWTYTILVDRRNDLIAKLKDKGIEAQRLHIRNDIYSCFGTGKQNLPGVDFFGERTLSIPCGWWVSDRDRSYIVDSIREGW